MGIVKEYVDRSVQTETDTVPSPYADPAVVLVAPSITRRIAQEAHAGTHNSSVSDGTHTVLRSPENTVFTPLVSCRLSKGRHARWLAGEVMNRRIVSMPENKSEPLSKNHGKRVVSMPDRVRTVLEPSADLFQSPSTAAGDSFGSYGGRHDRGRVFCTPSDVPQTPSPPSSPESLLIIASGTQLSEGFLRRKYSPEPLIEEDEDWVAWANSPPRPIPALHGPLSLPYARCPSGAEGTIIEEPDNVAQVIWGLGSDDQPHNQARAEGHSTHSDDHRSVPLHGTNQAAPRLQKKRCSAAQQVQKSSRSQTHGKQNVIRSHRQAHEDKRSALSQASPDIETRRDIANDLAWNEGQTMPINTGDNFINDMDTFQVDSNRILEWQLARLRQVLGTSLVDTDPHATRSGRLEPVIPTAVTSGLPQSYPRIFVEPRPNESVNSSTRQSSIDIAQQYRQQQLYRQALQKQKLQIQNLLPTPPNSSSPQWSSHFSPYLTYCSTLSPELVGSTEHPVPVSSQKFWSGANAPQYLRHFYDRHELESSFDTNANTPPTKTPQIVSHQAPSLGQGSSSSSTLAKYIKQLQALSPIAQFSPLQPIPPPNASSTSADESTGSFRTVYHSPAVPTPPSPESPQALPRGSSYHSARSINSSRSVQRRLSSVPEEDNALLELSTSLSPSRLHGQVITDSIVSCRDPTMGHQIRYADETRKSAIPEVAEFENNLAIPSLPLHHEVSPVKVRLPITKEHYIREQTSEQEQNKGHPHGHRKKYRYKKLKVPAMVNEQATTRGLVG